MVAAIDNQIFSDTGNVSIGVGNINKGFSKPKYDPKKNRLFKKVSQNLKPQIITPVSGKNDREQSIRILAADDTGHDLLADRGVYDKSSFVKNGALGYLMTGDNLKPVPNEDFASIYKSELNSAVVLGNDVYSKMTGSSFENRVAAAFEERHDLHRAIEIVTYDEITAGVTIIGKPTDEKKQIIKIKGFLRDIAQRSNGSLQITTDRDQPIPFSQYKTSRFKDDDYDVPMRKISYFMNWYLHNQVSQPEDEKTEVTLDIMEVLCDGGQLLLGTICGVDDSLVTPVIEPSVIGDSADTGSSRFDPNIEIETKLPTEHQLVPVVSNYFSAEKIFMCYVTNDGVTLDENNLYGFSLCFVKFDYPDDKLIQIVKTIRETQIMDQGSQKYKDALDAMLLYIQTNPNKVPRYYFGAVEKGADVDDALQCGTCGAGVAYIGEVMNAVTDVLGLFKSGRPPSRKDIAYRLNQVKEKDSSHRIPIADARILKMFPDLTPEEILLIYDIIADYKRTGDYQQAYTALKRLLAGRKTVYSSGDELSALIARLLGVPTILQVTSSGKCILYKGVNIMDPVAAAAAAEADKLIRMQKSLTKYIQVFQDADYITKNYSDSVSLIKQQLKTKLTSLIGKGSIQHIRTLIIILKLYSVWIKLDEFTRLNTYQESVLSDAVSLNLERDASRFEAIKQQHTSVSIFVNFVASTFPFMMDKSTITTLGDFSDMDDSELPIDESQVQGLPAYKKMFSGYLPDIVVIPITIYSKPLNLKLVSGKFFGRDNNIIKEFEYNRTLTEHHGQSKRYTAKEAFRDKLNENNLVCEELLNELLKSCNLPPTVKYTVDEPLILSTIQRELATSVDVTFNGFHNEGVASALVPDVTSIDKELSTKGLELQSSIPEQFPSKKSKASAAKVPAALPSKVDVFEMFKQYKLLAGLEPKYALSKWITDNPVLFDSMKRSHSYTRNLIEILDTIKDRDYDDDALIIDLLVTYVYPYVKAAMVALVAEGKVIKYDTIGDYTKPYGIYLLNSDGSYRLMSRKETKKAENVFKQGANFDTQLPPVSMQFDKQVSKPLPPDSLGQGAADQGASKFNIGNKSGANKKKRGGGIQSGGATFKQREIYEKLQGIVMSVLEKCYNYLLNVNAFVDLKNERYLEYLITKNFTKDMGRDFLGVMNANSLQIDDDYKLLDPDGIHEIIRSNDLDTTTIYKELLENEANRNYNAKTSKNVFNRIKSNDMSLKKINVNSSFKSKPGFEDRLLAFNGFKVAVSFLPMLDISQIARDKNLRDTGQLNALNFPIIDIQRLLDLMNDKFEVGRFCNELLVGDNSILVDDEDQLFSLRTALLDLVLTYNTSTIITKPKISDHLADTPTYYEHDSRAVDLDLNVDEADFEKLFGIGSAGVSSSQLKRKKDDVVSPLAAASPPYEASLSSVASSSDAVSSSDVNQSSQLKRKQGESKDEGERAFVVQIEEGENDVGELKYDTEMEDSEGEGEIDAAEQEENEEDKGDVKMENSEKESEPEFDVCKPNSNSIVTYETIVETVLNEIKCKEISQDVEKDVLTDVMRNLPYMRYPDNMTITGSILDSNLVDYEYTIQIDRFDAWDIDRFFNTPEDNQFNNYSAIREYFKPSLAGGDADAIFELPNMTIQEMVKSYGDMITSSNAVNIWKFFNLEFTDYDNFDSYVKIKRFFKPNDNGSDYGEDGTDDGERKVMAESEQVMQLDYDNNVPFEQDIMRKIPSWSIRELSDYKLDDNQICDIWIFFHIDPDNENDAINNESIDRKFSFFVESDYKFDLDENEIPYWDNMEISELLNYREDKIEGGLSDEEIVYCRTNQKLRGSEEQQEEYQRQEPYKESESDQVIEEDPMSSVIREFFEETPNALNYIQLLSFLLMQPWSAETVRDPIADKFIGLLFNNDKNLAVKTMNDLLSNYKFDELASDHPDMPYSVAIFIFGSLYPYFYNCIHKSKRSPTAMFTSNDNCAFDMGTKSFMRAFIGKNVVSTRSSNGGSKTKRRNKKLYNNLKTRANAKLKVKSSRKHRKSLRKHTFTQRNKF
jgi:hypothetical protein